MNRVGAGFAFVQDRAASHATKRARLIVRACLSSATAVAAVLAIPALAAGYASGPDFKPLSAGDSNGSVAFDWSNRCDGDDEHLPDLATRAFRDDQGRVQLIISHASFDQGNQPDLGGARRMFGLNGDLGTLTKNCDQLLLSDHEYNPASHNTMEWLAAPYTTDGQRVYSLIYDEYQPFGDPSPLPNDACASSQIANGDKRGCWYSSLTLGQSTNRGDLYGHQASPGHFVAGIPYQYTAAPSIPPLGNQPIGYSSVSNIIKGPGGYYYVAFLAGRHPKAPDNAVQKFGTCVMRTADLSSPTSWRAWDGDSSDDSQNGFTRQFLSPYPNEPADKAAHVCEPVNHLDQDGQVMADNTIGMSESLTYNRYLGKFMIAGESPNNTAGRPGIDPPVDDDDVDIFYSLSDDLVNWETKKVLLHVPHRFEGCNTNESGDTILYTSVLDHDSTNRNFETTGKKFYVYFTRYNGSCGVGDPADGRDLIRVPVEFTREPVGDRRATLEDGSLDDSDTGFDSWTGSGGAFELKSGGIGAYQGNNYAQATYLSGSGAPNGSLNVNWSSGSDVWYSMGVWMPTNFSDDHTDASIMEWTNPDETKFGGIFLGADHQWRLMRGTVAISPAFSIPGGQWVSLHVHQRLSQTNPLNQVFVKGELVAQSTTSNIFPLASAAPARVKFGLPRVSGPPGVVYVDNAYVGRNQEAPPDAPSVPAVFSGAEGNGYNMLYWHVSAGATGYRLYRQSANGTLTLLGTVPSTAWLDLPAPNCVTQRYVLTAYNATGRHSALSETLDLMPRNTSQPPCF
jgi:hypothetical protein